MKLLLLVSLTLVLTTACLAQQVCPTNAVFLALENQLRGYPLRANGPTVPCQIIQGSDTSLETARSLAFSTHGYVHIAQFLTNSTFDIFAPGASGNADPSRSIQLPENDLVSIAVDSKSNDFVLSIRQPAMPIFVAPNGSSGFLANPIVISDANIAEYASLAVDSDDDLLVAGYDSMGNARIDTLGTSQSLTSPKILRSIFGRNTGLFAGGAAFADNNISIAIDPQTDELYVYNFSASQMKSQVSVFARDANGDERPMRIIAGPNTTIGGPGFVGAQKIGFSSDGRLFVAEPNNRILVFAPGAAGNISPAQIIQDSTLAGQQVDQGGIGVRSCSCK